jgi:hypothetical protein
MNISIELDEETYGKFKLALELAHEEQDKALDNLVKSYISRVFLREARRYASNDNSMSSNVLKFTTLDNPTDYTVSREYVRLRRWSMNHSFICSRLLKSYFLLSDKGPVKVTDLMTKCLDICQDKEFLSEARVKNNYAQMKSDGPKSYGKFFKDDGTYVTLEDNIKEEATKLKKRFLADD